MSRGSKHHWFGASLKMLFVLVTLIGVSLGLWRRASLLQELSKEHAFEAHTFASSDRWYDKMPQRGQTNDDKRQHLRRQQALHKEWSQRYREAIWRPWRNPEGKLPVPKLFHERVSPVGTRI